LNAINICLTQIDSLPEGDIKRNYLNYLRWNNLIISTQLDDFAEIAHLQNLLTSEIETCQEKIKTTIKSYFELNNEEKGLCNQYVHALSLAKDLKKRPGTLYTKALQHTGRLLINYLNFLQIRGYNQKLDRMDTTFEQLKNEVEFVKTELRGLDDALASDIKDSIKLYEDFRDLDDCNAAQQDQLMEHALKLAHGRATENRLETVLRFISETMNMIKQMAAKKIEEAWEVSTAIFNPILHPIESTKNVIYAFKNMRKTLTEVVKWAKENPWKSAFIVLGGILIGACGVGGPLALVFALDVALLPVVAGVNALKIKEKRENDLKIEEAKAEALKSENTKEGEIIAREVLINQHRRDVLRKANELVDEQARNLRESEKQKNEVIKSQLDSMDLAKLNQTESALNDEKSQLEKHLRETQSDLQESQVQFLQRQADLESVRNGLNAVARLSQANAQRHQVENKGVEENKDEE
jgi:hypothetical protein